jgi:predicted nucleic acid-binding protein
LTILVDTNVILDLVTEDPHWADWSESMLQKHADQVLCVNPIIFSELCVGAESMDEVLELLDELSIEVQELSFDALFLAAKAFRQYREQSGTKRSPLPDFYIGGQALDRAMPILTRDPRRFATYFPEVQLLCPDTKNG